MEEFMIRSFICNIFISMVIGILVLAWRLLKFSFCDWHVSFSHLDHWNVSHGYIDCKSAMVISGVLAGSYPTNNT